MTVHSGSSNKDPKARVSILHWNRPEECLQTVQALKEQGVAMHITVIDNASSAENIRLLELQLAPDIELWKLPENLGWGKAHNKVIRRWLEGENTEYCLVCAHDALPAEGCVGKLLSAMQEHPRWGLCCPEYGKPELPTFSLLRGTKVRETQPRKPGETEEVEFCHGTLSVLRRACIREIGPFDEEFFAYGDETEIGLRARRHGWSIGLVWGACLTNPGTWSSGPVLAYLFSRNGLLLAQRVAGIGGLSIRLLVLLGSLLRDWIHGVPTSSDRSPMARWYGIRDFFRHQRSAPPQEVHALATKNASK